MVVFLLVIICLGLAALVLLVLYACEEHAEELDRLEADIKREQEKIRRLDYHLSETSKSLDDLIVSARRDLKEVSRER